MARPSYALENRTLPGGGEVIRVYERDTLKTMWRRIFPNGFAKITWSQDNRALAFEMRNAPDEYSQLPYYGFHIFVWRDNNGVRVFSKREFEQNDYVEDFYWSPDNQRLMFRTGNGGMADVDHGDLWCLDLETNKANFVSSNVAGPTWIGPHWSRPQMFAYRRLVLITNPKPGLLWDVSKKTYHYLCR